MKDEGSQLDGALNILHVKQSKARQMSVGHTRAKNAFSMLQSTTEQLLTATRSYRKSTHHCDESFDVGVDLRDLRWSCSRRTGIAVRQKSDLFIRVEKKL